MKYRAEIDGLRAIAVVPVLLFHAGLSFFSGGFVGVDVFFVISGYLITQLVQSELSGGTFSFLRFYERRARRILPAMFTVLLVTLPFAWCWLLPQAMRSYSQSLVSVAGFSSNVFFWLQSGYFDVASEFKPLLHTWSLAVEEQFYLLFPALLVLLWRRARAHTMLLLALFAAASMALAQWASLHRPAAAFFLLPTRGWELVAGALLAQLPVPEMATARSRYVAEALGWVGLAAILYSIVAFNSHTPFPGLFALVPTLGTALTIRYATPQTFAGKLLATRLLVGMGLISYSAYLWHQPLLALARNRALNELGTSSSVFLVGLAVPLAYLTWRFIEQPMRRGGSVSRTRLFASGATISLALAAFGIVGSISNGFEFRLPRAERELILHAAGAGKSSSDCQREGSHFAALESSCVLGDRSHVVGALIGDSHANSIAAELGKQLAAHGVGVFQMTFNGCPAILGAYRVDFHADDACTKFNADAMDYLGKNSSLEYVIVVSRWTRALSDRGFDNLEGGVEHTSDLVGLEEDGQRIDGPETARVQKLQRAIGNTIRDYLALGKKVILVYPIPEVGWSAPEFLVKQKLSDGVVTQRSTSYLVFESRNKPAIETLDQLGSFENLTRIYPSKVLCNSFIADRCVFGLNGESLYSDHNHLSSEGARLVVERIAQAVQRRSHASQPAGT